MGLRNLFKVRQPGNGNAVQEKFEQAARAKVSVSTKDSSDRNGGKKKGVIKK